METAKIHMNSQGTSRGRKTTTIKGKNKIGSQPIQAELSTTLADSILSASSNVVSFSRGHACFIHRWKWISVRANKAAHQFGAREVTKAQ